MNGNVLDYGWARGQIVCNVKIGPGHIAVGGKRKSCLRPRIMARRSTRSRSYSRKRRSEASKKAWRKRKSAARRRSKRRSEASKKGWRTRRSKSRRSKSASRRRKSRSYSRKRRSDASKKGWRTRRRNERRSKSKSKRRSKSKGARKLRQSMRYKSRSSSGGGRRGCWGDFTLGELRAITQDLKDSGAQVRMHKKRSDLCRQLNRQYGLEASIERSMEKKRAEKEAKRDVARAKKDISAAKKEETRRRRSRERAGRMGILEPDGAYPGHAQATEDFIRAYAARNYKTEGARKAAMTRDLRDREKASRRRHIDHRDAASYQAWKKAPWDSDIKGLDSAFFEGLRAGGFIDTSAEEFSFEERESAPYGSQEGSQEEEESTGGGLLALLGLGDEEAPADCPSASVSDSVDYSADDCSGAARRAKLLQLHPDKNPGCADSSSSKFARYNDQCDRIKQGTFLQ